MSPFCELAINIQEKRNIIIKDIWKADALRLESLARRIFIMIKINLR